MNLNVPDRDSEPSRYWKMIAYAFVGTWLVGAIALYVGIMLWGDSALPMYTYLAATALVCGMWDCSDRADQESDGAGDRPDHPDTAPGGPYHDPDQFEGDGS